MEYLIKRTAKTERYDCKDDFIDRLLDITSIAEDTGAETLTLSVAEDITDGRTVSLDHIINLLTIQTDKYIRLATKSYDDFVKFRYESDKCKALFHAQKFLGIYRGLLVVMNTYSQPLFDRTSAKNRELEEFIGMSIQKYYKYKIKE